MKYLKHRNGMRLRQDTFDRWERNAILRTRELELNPPKPLRMRNRPRPNARKKRKLRYAP